MRKQYPSDITQAQFAKIHPMLEAARKKTKPRLIDLHEVFCAVLSDFPKWRTAHSYFQRWSEKRENGLSILEEVLKKIVSELRVKSGRKEQTSLCIVDSQSVKNTDTAKEKWDDGGKKISGIKRHIAVDSQGLPHAIHITTADQTD